MLYASARYFAKRDRSKIALGAPFGKFENVVESLDAPINPLKLDENKASTGSCSYKHNYIIHR